MSKYLIYSLVWSMTGDSRLKVRQELGDFLRGITTVPLPSPNIPIIDYEVSCLHYEFLKMKCMTYLKIGCDPRLNLCNPNLILWNLIRSNVIISIKSNLF